MVLQRQDIINNLPNRFRNYFYANSKRIGDISNDGPSREDYVQSLASSKANPDPRNWTPIASADFDQNFEPITANYPAQSPGSYTVNIGDTLRSIASSLWGDGAMWYLIADANGLEGDEPLKAGQILIVPNKVTNIHSNSSTFRPYSPGEALGDIMPTLPAPPPPPIPPRSSKKCGGLAKMVMIAVAVVATIYTAGAAASLFAGGGLVGGGLVGGGFAAGSVAMLGGTTAAAAVGVTAATTIGIGAAIGGAVISAAVGNIASQLVGKAMGAVDNFSWSQVGVSALTAGATAGIGGGLAQLAPTTSWASSASNTLNMSCKGGWALAQSAVANGALNYASNYAANRVMGVGTGFSWSGVAGSVAGSYMGGQLNGSFGRVMNPSLGRYASNLAGANAGAFMDDKWFGGATGLYGCIDGIDCQYCRESSCGLDE